MKAGMVPSDPVNQEPAEISSGGPDFQLSSEDKEESNGESLVRAMGKMKESLKRGESRLIAPHDTRVEQHDEEDGLLLQAQPGVSSASKEANK